MKKRITAQQRARQDELRRQTLQIARYYQAVLLAKRTHELKRVLGYLEKVPVNDWVSKIPQMADETYLKNFYRSMFLNIGTPASKDAINDFLNRKSDMWQDVLDAWLNKNAGQKVKIINEGFQTWVKTNLSKALTDQTQSVESMTQSVYKTVLGKWAEVREWEIRRIVQTESLNALRTAGIESINALNIPYEKTWVIAGNNTRPDHLAADGQTVANDEPFVVGGELLMYPGDDSMGASAGNIINCSCTSICSPK